MALHLIKLCVGVDSVEHLAELQAERLRQASRRGALRVLRHVTRNAPKRGAEILDGGSIYWVIRGFIRVRQRIRSLDQVADPERGPACAIVLDPRHVRTELRPCRPFQGWRYLAPGDAPPDARKGAGSGRRMPEALETELKVLGLL